MDDENKLEDYPVYGDCNTCEHQNEVCTNCMSRNTAGEWVHNLYSPKPGVYTLPNQRQITSELTTTTSILGQWASSVNSLHENVRYLRKRLEAAEDVIHAIGFSSGRLDVCGGSETSLLALCKDVSTQLSMAAGNYWEKYGENPLHPVESQQ